MLRTRHIAFIIVLTIALGAFIAEPVAEPRSQPGPGLDVSVKLTLPTGQHASLVALANGQPTALIVIKGHWCSVCTDLLATFANDATRARLDAIGARVLGLSNEPTETNQTLMQKLSLNFPVLADPGERLLKPMGFLPPQSRHPIPGLIFLDRCGDPVYQLRGRTPGISQEQLILDTLEKLAREPSDCRNVI